MNGTIEDIEQREQALAARVKESRSVRYALADKQNEDIKRRVLESYRIDVADKTKIDFRNPFFSFKGMREAVYRQCSTLRETNPEAAFSAVLRAGINNFCNEWYKLVNTVYEQIVGVTPSGHAVEPYAPIARGSSPTMVPRGTPFREQKIQAPYDIQLVNEKYGAIASAPQELIDDDQTGQIVDRIRDIGPNMALLEEAWVMGVFISPSGGTLYQGEIIPASKSNPTIETSATWPWSTALLGGGQNRLNSYTVFSNNAVQEADYYLLIQKDENGNYMAIDPDTLLVGAGLKILGRQLMNSTWYPSTAAQLVGGGVVGSTATSLGTTFAENQMKGMYQLVLSRFLPSGAWAVGQAHRGMVFQMREGLSVVQQMPLSGSSFTNDEIVWRSKSRWRTDWIEPRFWCLGNDGTAT